MGKKVQHSKYFISIIALLTFGILIILWMLLNDTTKCESWKNFFSDLIIGVLAPLVSFLILYIVFLRRGIPVDQIIKENDSWLIEGYEKFDDIEWKSYIDGSSKIVIVAFYIEEWLDKYRNNFLAFFNKENARIVIYLPDYNDNELMVRLNQLIPEHTVDILKKKIKDSISLIKDMTNGRSQDVTVRLYKGLFNYTVQQFDEGIFLSINQLKRDKHYISPFIIIDLKKSITIKSFFEREIKTLESDSDIVNIPKWKP